MYDLSVIANSTEDQIYTEGFSRHYFNQFVSDKLDPNRTIPDVRHKLCKNRDYPVFKLPTVTVVICFLNEAFSALIRTIHSVINRTPSELLKEIIIIDDFSSFEDLKGHLGTHLKIKYYKKVILLRNPVRKGLIMSRIIGSRHATAEVLVFLDSHCEVNTGWIEPLLDRIVLNRKTVVAPIVDSVDAYTMVYDSVPVLVGGFKWNLFFRWDPIPVKIRKMLSDLSQPIKSPTISGGLFAIDKEYFKELGEYDPKLKIWGGENMEISFKVWQCGGKIEIVPCSRVGHIYRQVQPNNDKNDVNIKRNLLRVAHTWMDEYQQYVYDARPNLEGVEYGDITERVTLRNRLRCQSFSWYLKTIFPEQVRQFSDSHRFVHFTDIVQTRIGTYCSEGF
ncbi:hypothetical protein LOTGIDRAFT_104326 [Lottia gigantea]|uniref:Glycosyltransferase 2-like domain-containing protein n=1 Tax=Lottia gigantea TaxID=225164 RepID=V4AKQ6_LOTGI|nr:hypothetical protein LOTGIDRAFT_104326 [Lottia gigantea]ESO97702.1 hypothetical protein LOTGIDRAFT_104326 [Lottia gigantea]